MDVVDNEEIMEVMLPSYPNETPVEIYGGEGRAPNNGIPCDPAQTNYYMQFCQPPYGFRIQLASAY